MQHIIETSNLTKRYGKQNALDNVSMRVRQGEIYGLIGKNGAGKSTFFKVLMGLTSKSSGEMSILEETSISGLDESRRSIGFMMGASFFPYLTAAENLEYFRKLKGITDKNEVNRVLDLVEMTNVKKKFKTFSMGMKQRVSIANALMGNPDIVILDEPINGLDPQGIADFRKVIQRLNRERKMTFIVSSHILGELDLMATRFGFLNNGILVEEIDREEIRKKIQNQVIVKVDNVEKASYLLEEHFEAIDYKVNGDKEIIISHLTDHTEEIAELFMSNGLKLSKLNAQEQSLEDYFLELINQGGEANAAIH